MKLLVRSLQDYPPAMLRAIAEVNGQSLSSNVVRAMAEQLAGFLDDGPRLTAALASCSPAARAALDELLRTDGRSLRIPFERQHGVIRAMGPGRLERERPHLAPANPTEELWYRGLIHSAFAETAAGMVEFLYVPDDIVALLPPPAPAQDGLRLPICQAPATAQAADDLLLHDICTLLCLVQAGEIVLTNDEDPTSWQRTSLYELSRYSLQPGLGDDGLLGGPAALALALAADLGWLQPRGRRRLALRAAALRTWLEAPRHEQRRTVLEAWRSSPAWNDLCRTPSLACEDTGNWQNEPIATRARLLPLLAQLNPGAWHELDALVAAIKATAPDFQRPDGVYDTWYVRERHSRTYLRGFDSWDAVEGALLRFLVAGPLHWLGVFDLSFSPTPAATAAARSDELQPAEPALRFSLTAQGHAWLRAQPVSSEPEAARRLAVLADYTILVPASAPLLDRFQVSRFTSWEPPALAGPGSESAFRYRVTQSGLRRAAAQGIDAQRVLAFLQEHAEQPLPAVVVAGLERWRG